MRKALGTYCSSCLALQRIVAYFSRCVHGRIYVALVDAKFIFDVIRFTVIAPLHRVRPLGFLLRFGQRHTDLPLVLAATVFVRSLANFAGFKK